MQKDLFMLWCTRCRVPIGYGIEEFAPESHYCDYNYAANAAYTDKSIPYAAPMEKVDGVEAFRCPNCKHGGRVLFWGSQLKEPVYCPLLQQPATPEDSALLQNWLSQ